MCLYTGDVVEVLVDSLDFSHISLFSVLDDDSTIHKGLGFWEGEREEERAAEYMCV